MRAVVTGSLGQCGSYLCEFLLQKGYEVFAVVRRNTLFEPSKSFLKGCLGSEKFHIVKGDVTDLSSIKKIVERARPDEFYNAASQSHVHESWEIPIMTAEVNAIGTLNCLQALREDAHYCRFLQFSTSELFGKIDSESQSEITKFHPRSPYAVSKIYAYWITVNYRESYDLFASNAIFFNMESPRRGSDFVTQKIAKGIARIKKSIDANKEFAPLGMGNLNSKRDWNDARESIQYGWKILQLDKPDDFVIGSGKHYSIGDFVKEALNVLDIEYIEKYNPEYKQNEFFLKDGRPLIITDPKFFRPAEVSALKADSSKAQRILDYKPKSTLNFIVRDMVEAAMKDHNL